MIINISDLIQLLIAIIMFISTIFAYKISITCFMFLIIIKEKIINIRPSTRSYGRF